MRLFLCTVDVIRSSSSLLTLAFGFSSMMPRVHSRSLAHPFDNHGGFVSLFLFLSPVEFSSSILLAAFLLLLLVPHTFLFCILIFSISVIFGTLCDHQSVKFIPVQSTCNDRPTISGNTKCCLYLVIFFPLYGCSRTFPMFFHPLGLITKSPIRKLRFFGHTRTLHYLVVLWTVSYFTVSYT